MCFYIKALGDWTNKLRDAFQARITDEIIHPLEVHIRGPFGAPAQHVRGYQRVVLISGGVGATPFCSICKDLYGRIVSNNSLNTSPSSRDSGTEDNSKNMLRAEEELMSCMTQVYDKNVYTSDDDEDEECNEPGLYSLNELFAVTNERSRVREITPLCTQRTSKGDDTQWNQETSSHHVEKGVRRRESNISITKRMSFCSSSYLMEKGHSDITSSADGSSMNRALWIDGIDAARVIRDVVYVSRRQRALTFLHTIGMSIVIYMVMLTRITILALASIFGGMDAVDSTPSPQVFSNVWLNVVDLFLGTFILSIVTGTLCLELFMYRWAFFEMRGRILDTFILVPLIVLSLLCGIHSILDGGDTFFLSAQIQVFVVFPLLTFLLVHRLYRIIGSRVLLADSFAKSDFVNIRALDFIWTIPYEDDDNWLRDELSPLANGTQLHLHRFVTREKCIETANDGDSVRGMATTSG